MNALKGRYPDLLDDIPMKFGACPIRTGVSGMQNQNNTQLYECPKLAPASGFEPLASELTVQRSDQLSYTGKLEEAARIELASVSSVVRIIRITVSTSNPYRPHDFNVQCLICPINVL